MALGGWSYDPNKDPNVVKDKMLEYFVVSIELTREVDRSEIARQLIVYPEVDRVFTFPGGEHALMAILIHHDFDHLMAFLQSEISKLPGFKDSHTRSAKEMIVRQPPVR